MPWFEQQTILLDNDFRASHLEALLAFNAAQGQGRFFQPAYRGLRTNNYVGFLSVGDYSVEILPKLGQEQAAAGQWRNLFLSMLFYVEDLPLHLFWEQAVALQDSEQRLGLGQLLWWSWANWMEDLLRQGLVRQYRQQAQTLPHLRGRLDLRRQLSLGAGQAMQFFTQSQVYDEQHPLHHILHQALLLGLRQPLPAALLQRLRALLAAFPPQPWQPLPSVLPTLDERTQHYGPALRLAWLLLQSLDLAWQFGKVPLAGMLWHMPQLYERYLHKRLLLDFGLDLQAQQAQAFAPGRSLRPDFQWPAAQGLVLADAKWKHWPGAAVSTADLQQMLLYQHLLQAPQAWLLYPSLEAEPLRLDLPLFHRLGNGQWPQLSLLRLSLWGEEGLAKGRVFS